MQDDSHVEMQTFQTISWIGKYQLERTSSRVTFSKLDQVNQGEYGLVINWTLNQGEYWTLNHARQQFCMWECKRFRPSPELGNANWNASPVEFPLQN